MTIANPPTEPTEATRTWHRWAIVLIVLASAAPRFYGIGRESLWADEILTWRIVTSDSLARLISQIRFLEQIPPTHYLVLHFWVKLFGTSEVSLRMPSALAGIASVWAMYVFVRRLAGPTAGIFAALLIAASPFQIYYAKEARAYALMMLLAIVSCDIFVRLARRATTRLEVGYVVVSVLLLYTHLYGAFALLAQHFAYFAALRRSPRPGIDPRRWITLNVAVVALFSPWAPIVLEWMSDVAIHFWVTKVTWWDALESYRQYAGSAPLLIIMFVLMIAGVRRPRARLELALLIAVMLLPVIVPVIISILRRPIFSPRYGMIASIGLYALAATGLVAIRLRSVQLFALAAICVLAFFANPIEYRKPQWRELGEFLTRQMRPGDFATIQMKPAAYGYDYYVHRPDVRRISFTGSALPLTLPLDEGKHVWLILYGSPYTAEEMIQRGNWRVLQHHKLRHLDLYELTDKPKPTTTPGQID